jgi:hypothetical protein
MGYGMPVVPAASVGAMGTVAMCLVRLGASWLLCSDGSSVRVAGFLVVYMACLSVKVIGGPSAESVLGFRARAGLSGR